MSQALKEVTVQATLHCVRGKGPDQVWSERIIPKVQSKKFRQHRWSQRLDLFFLFSFRSRSLTIPFPSPSHICYSPVFPVSKGQTLGLSLDIKQVPSEKPSQSPLDSPLPRSETYRISLAWQLETPPVVYLFQTAAFRSLRQGETRQAGTSSSCTTYLRFLARYDGALHQPRRAHGCWDLGAVCWPLPVIAPPLRNARSTPPGRASCLILNLSRPATV